MKKKNRHQGKTHERAGVLVAIGIFLSILSITLDLPARIPPLLAVLWVQLSYAQTQDGTASAAAFLKASQVFLSPRCINCHPSGDGPLQHDTSLPHAMNIKRGPEGLGKGGVHCNTCHQSENQTGANMPPGASGWKLPPENMPMAFEKKGPHDLCLQLKDPFRNNNSTLQKVLEHVRTAPLVRWAWSPGEGRVPVTMPYSEFIEYMTQWVEKGGSCPE